jgi:hypothetical protein
VTVAVGVLLVVLPIAFNVVFALLGARFDYPDVLRRPTAEILERFRTGGSGLVLLWWAFAMTAVLMVPLAVLLPGALAGADDAVLTLGAVVGVLAAVVQLLGLLRWPFLVPYLARTAAEAEAAGDEARAAATDVVFQAFHRYLGVAVGEHLGYLLTGLWTMLVGVGVLQSGVAPGWVAWVGIVVGAVLALCSLEFVGPFEPAGWRLAGAVTPIAYVAWSLWLVGVGVALLT